MELTNILRHLIRPKTKQNKTVKQAQVPGTLDPLEPAELTVHVTPDGFGWGL